MPLYFAQHGKSRPKEIDPERSLTEEGVEETRGVAAGLKRRGIVVSRIVHSGKTRARQTAEIFAEYLLSSGKTEPSAGLDPGDDVRAFTKRLDFDGTLYVGHLPFMERLVSYLVSGSETGRMIGFKNSSVVCLDRGSGEGIVSIGWMLAPTIHGAG